MAHTQPSSNVAACIAASACILLCFGLGSAIGSALQPSAEPSAAECHRVHNFKRCQQQRLAASQERQVRAAVQRYAERIHGQVSPADASARVAIATLWDGSASYECALPMWCYAASQLAKHLPWAVELVVLAPRESGECAGAARFVWHDATWHAIVSYVSRRIAEEAASAGRQAASAGKMADAAGVADAETMEVINRVLNRTGGLAPSSADPSSASRSSSATPEAVPSSATISRIFSPRGCSRPSCSAPASVLLKLSVFALTEFDLVIFADLDISLAPSATQLPPFHIHPSVWKSVDKGVWAAHLGAFIASPMLMAAQHDHEAPVNTGLMLIKPRRWLYEEGLDLLRHASWTPAGGFRSSFHPQDPWQDHHAHGHAASSRVRHHSRRPTAPRQLINSSRLLAALGAGAGWADVERRWERGVGDLVKASSAPRAHSRVVEALSRLGHVMRGTWDFVGGECERRLRR